MTLPIKGLALPLPNTLIQQATRGFHRRGSDLFFSSSIYSLCLYVIVATECNTEQARMEVAKH
jgi:hypothetical protein